MLKNVFAKGGTFSAFERAVNSAISQVQTVHKCMRHLWDCGDLQHSCRQRTKRFIHLLKNLVRVNANDSVLYLVDGN